MSDDRPPPRRLRYTREQALADKRWVDPAAPDSNQRLVAKTLLQGPASATRFVPLMTGHRPPEAGQQACRKALERALQPGPAESMPIRAVLRACRAAIDVCWSP